MPIASESGGCKVWASALAFACVLIVLGILLCLPFCLTRTRGLHPAIDHAYEWLARLMGASAPTSVRSKSARRPAPKSALRRLKTTPYRRPADIEAGAEDCCAICFTDFEAGEGVVVMPVCVHYFHQHCLRSWLAIDAVCPICKAALVPREDDARQQSAACTCPRAQPGAASGAAASGAAAAAGTAAAPTASGSSRSSSSSSSPNNTCTGSCSRLTRPPPPALLIPPPPPSAGVAGQSP